MRKMKDSGIVRLGLMPKEWSASRVKYIYSVIGSGTTPSSGNTLYYDGTENWIQSGDLYKRKYVTNTEKKISDFAVSTISALHKYKADFIVIAMYGASIGNVAISKIDACVNQACCVIKPNSKVNFNYLYYTLVNDKDIMLDMSIGGTQPNISQAKILELPVFLPSLAEQQKIADFLDEKCGEIDSIRSDIQKQIDILNDYKKSVITEAVTKGLNPKAKLKDSGIKWVGNIPAHWECKPIGIFFREICRKNIDGAVTNPLKFTYGAIVPKPDFDANSDEYVAKTILNYNVVDFGTIMINGLNLNYDLVSQRVALVQNKGIITSAYLAIKAKREIEMNPYYAMYAFKFYDYCMAFHNMGEGVRKTLGFEELKHVYFMLPPIQEQNAIVSHLDEKCSEIDAIIADKQKQLETLDEYKKSLIFEYVTGKKEVS